MSAEETIRVQLIGDIWEGYIRVTYDGTDEEQEDANEIAARFNNHPERLARLSGQPEGICLIRKETE